MALKLGQKVQPKSIMRSDHYDHRRQLLPRHTVHHRKRSSTLKTKYFSVILSIRKSIQKCHRRLLKFFSTLEGAKRRGQGFVILQREEADSGGFKTCNSPRLQLEFEADSDLTSNLVLRKHNRNRLPPLASDKLRTIVLDLDETLVHASPDPPPKTYDFMMKPNGVGMDFYVLKRPGVDEFLESISRKYELVVFTAGLEPYASLLLDNLDPKGLISHRLYRESCKQSGRGRFVKDLSTIGRDLGKVVIVDDNPISYSLQPANGVPIKRFEDDMEDRELEKLRMFFESYCDGFDDMRDAVKQYFEALYFRPRGRLHIHHREVAGSSGFESRDRPRLQVEFQADPVLTDTLESRKSNRNRLPPLVSDKLKTIVLDLDETLVHSSPDSPPETYDFMIKPNVYGLRMDFYVSKRPGVDEFLEAISKKYELVVFTAGLEPYASLLLDNLDPKGLISHRLCRDSCKHSGRGKYVKDLSTTGRDLEKIVIVDDNPKSYSLQPANGIPIKRFEDDEEDRELEKLRVFFERYCDGFDDMRGAVKQYCSGGGDTKSTQPQSSSVTSQ